MKGKERKEEGREMGDNPFGYFHEHILVHLLSYREREKGGKFCKERRAVWENRKKKDGMVWSWAG